MKSLKNRTAIILCGGKGTRLGLLGKKTPKSLVKINGRPIIWYIIKNNIKSSYSRNSDLKEIII